MRCWATTHVTALAAMLAMPSLDAAAATCEEATQNLADDPVRYFSPEGRKIAAACAIATPGIEVLPLGEIEPPRDVPAAKWMSPLCIDWHDATTRCTRKVDPAGAVSGAPACRPLDKDTVPVAHIVCTDFAVEPAQRLCAAMSLTQIDRYTNGTHDDFDMNGYPLWTYSLSTKQWDGSFDNDQRVVPAYKGPPRTLASRQKNAVCLHPFKGTMEDFVYIGR